MFGVRAARLNFVSETTAVRVTLFPMVHVGEAEFYDATYLDARTHDVVLLEGVDSPVSRRITRSYRWLAGSRTLRGLIIQPRFPAGAPPPQVIHADLTGPEFEAEWRSVPIWIRLLVYAMAPIMGLQRRWFYTRARLAKNMGCGDQTTLMELMTLSPETGALVQAILHA